MAEKKLRQEIGSIPNIICYFRFLLIPVFCFLYLTAETPREYYIAAGVLVVAALSDVVDGIIARRFNMITNLGKMIDPVADKLMQAAVAFSLTTRYSLMWVVIGVLAVKEIYMLIAGIINLKGGMEVYGARWFGKICTVVLFVSMIVLVILSPHDISGLNILIIVNIVFMLFSLLMYILDFHKKKAKEANE